MRAKILKSGIGDMICLKLFPDDEEEEIFLLKMYASIDGGFIELDGRRIDFEEIKT